MSPAALAAGAEIAAAVTGNLGGRGLFGVELFVKGDRSGSRKSARGRTTPGWSRCARSASRNSNCTPAPSSACRWTPPARAGRLGGDLRRHGGAGIAFEGVAEALAVPRSDLRLFGKPESFVKRRMGVAVANGADVVTKGDGGVTGLNFDVINVDSHISRLRENGQANQQGKDQ
jgi:phosphoribosylglycinamide formyltransferase 2